ncbi:MAG: 3'-5' exonuclease [Sphingobacteriales bacterium]|nr:MAG: 3'-5' exonuclease [Sphingobacteriales bacterium]TAF78952.1 MAG: 3'-5' exonuclease [Sphingobacteriales bacterium]
MRKNLLFIDTEATGLPKKWNLPYSKTKNWPHIVQLAWLIYDASGQEIKRENHYINETDFKISAQAQKIHAISPHLIANKGKSRQDVMHLLAQDVQHYQPMLVGHFIELDLHLLNADFYRAGINNDLKKNPVFCTMLASTKYVQNYGVKHLRLGQLFNILFDKKAENMHNALADAYATAQCFFELIKRGDITPELIEQQQQIIHKKQYHNDNYVKWAYLTFVTILIGIIIYLIWTKS